MSKSLCIEQWKLNHSYSNKAWRLYEEIIVMVVITYSRPYIYFKTASIIAVSIVHSKLDYCNLLLQSS